MDEKVSAAADIQLIDQLVDIDPEETAEWHQSLDAALETGGILVSENIKLEFEISAILAK